MFDSFEPPRSGVMFIERGRLIPEPGSFRSAAPLSPINRLPELSRVLLSINISSLRNTPITRRLQSFLSQFDRAKHCARFVNAFLKLLACNGLGNATRTPLHGRH